LEDPQVRVGRFIATFVILDIALLTVYLILYFTVFAEPTYVPFASGGVSTLVPEGPHRSEDDGPWHADYFGGKGSLVIRARRVPSAGLTDLVRQARARAAGDTGVQADTSAGTAGRSEAERRGPPLSDLVRRSMAPDSARGNAAAETDRGQIITAGRTLMQLLASNTPNLRLTEEIPAFDSAIFCLGAVGRGQRWYRYLLQSGDTIVDLSMHSPHSSHIVYKKVLDVAFLNLRVGGVASDHIAAQAVQEIDGRVSPRWAQGNLFWLLFFLSVPNGIMLILLLLFKLAGRSRGAVAGGAGSGPRAPSP
jgi:hypothetical protein